MKTKLFLLALVLFSSCTNSSQENKPLTNDEKDVIALDAKILINSIIKACENPNPEKLKSIWLDSQDFVSLVGGVYAGYNQSVTDMNAFFNNVTSQKSTLKDEKFSILDATTVLYTANSRWEAKMKNDSTVVMDPLVMQFLLKKIDNQWRVLSWTEVLKK